MPALNRVQLIGRLGKDPEARSTPTGKQVVSFSLAVSNHWKSGGETKESTDWFNKVVLQSMQMLDRKPEEDAGLAIEEAPAGYEA